MILHGTNLSIKAVKTEEQGEALDVKELGTNSENTVQVNTPIVKNGFVFGMSGRDNLFCINMQTGKMAWTAPAPKGSAAPPAGGGGGGRPGGGMRGRPGYGSIVDAGSVLFALTPSAQLVVFEPSDKEFKQLKTYKVADGDTYAYPVIAGKRIFVKDKDSVTLWMIE